MEPKPQLESTSKEIVVFELTSRKDSSCSGCQQELGKGSFLTVDNEKACAWSVLISTTSSSSHLVMQL